MSDPFLAEIRIFPFTFAPKGWAWCDGQILPLSQHTALFALLGTTYGGDGKSTFALPDFQDRLPIHVGHGPGLTQRDLGEMGGAASVTLQESEIPFHTHEPYANPDEGTFTSPAGHTWAVPRYGRDVERMYSRNTPNTTMGGQALAQAGQSAPHNNLPPYLTLAFCIALQGEFPQRP